MHCDKGKKIPLWTDSGLLSRWSKQLTGKFKPEAGGRILQTAANPHVRRHSESSSMSGGLQPHVPGRPESTDGSHFPVEPCQTARQMSQPWKWSRSWPGGIGENRRDSQGPTGGLAHRKGSQTHSRWQSRWKRNMDTGRWAGRRPGAGLWDMQAPALWSHLTAGAAPSLLRPEVPKSNLFFQAIDLFLKEMAWEVWNNSHF